MYPSIFFWNVRGLNDRDKHRPFKQWLTTNQPVVGAILETHIKEPNLNYLMNSVCPGWSYVSNHDTDADGRIIVIWKLPASVQVMHQSRQSMTCNIELPGAINFTYSAIYAVNTREERSYLWEELVEVQQTLFLENRNWIIGGDLNQIIHYDEHSSLSVDHLTADMIELRDHLLLLGMDDLRYQGSSHTWTNNQPEAPITKKLDRALVNNLWITSFPNSVATFLPQEFSDHTPCLINLSCPLPSSGTKPFKFLNFLSKHPTFLTVVETAWSESGNRASDLSSLGFKLKKLKRALKTLNKETFSDIQKRVAITNSLLKIVQEQAVADPSYDSFQRERDMHSKWTYLRGVEESFFRQKSRVNWLKEGDQNTTFFYRVATSRNSYNSIRSLSSSGGLPTSDPVEMSEIAVSHFKQILAPEDLPRYQPSLQWFLELHDFRCTASQKGLLSSLPSEAEISKTIFKLNPNKSPGPDGFTSAFFKAAWPIVGSEVLESIKNFFWTGFLPSATNATILSLVPKKPGSTAISDFRPISCCNTTYKAISKLLVSRLKVILPQVILPNQTAFVKGRLLIENTLLASEIVHGYHKEGGPKRITIKVDIAKAFDSIRWEFIFQCLRSL